MPFNRMQEILVLVIMVASFGLGYRMHMATNQTDIKDQTTQVKDNHTVITVVTSKLPEGGTKVVKTIDSDTKIKKTEKKDTVSQTSPNTWNVSALAGYDFSASKELKPIYGISVNKQILGPLTVGAYGLTNGIVGVSLGLNF